MLISLNWLKNYIDLPKGLSPQELGTKLILHTAEVESIIELGQNLDNVVVGKVIELAKHPQADKLRLAVVDIGVKKEKVVCGGTNLKKGMIVAFAKIGAKVKWHGQGDLVELKKAKIRGEESTGMICASSEIGLGEIYSCSEMEIMDLSEMDLKIGVPLKQALNLDDVVYEIENKTITHRADLWSHYGFARDISAILDIKFKDYKVKKPKINETQKLKVEIKDAKLCPRYMAVMIEGIKIQESPDWLKSAVTSIGMRPINNIVDITNYVMYDIGQPLHAFDANKLKSPKIIIRTAKDREKIKTIDEENRSLDKNDLVIADEARPIAIAGVMGGVYTEIDSKTQTVIIESANFDAATLRKTSERLGLRSEAVQRFEKSPDPNYCELGLLKCVNLIQQLIPGANIITKIIDEGSWKLDQGPINIAFEKINKNIGVEIPGEQIVKILEKLGFETKKKKDFISVKVPTWRASKDVSIEEDVIEEVARIYGIDSLEPKMPVMELRIPEQNKERKFSRCAKNNLVSQGFNEVYNYSFVNETRLKNLGIKQDGHIMLENPLSEHASMLRQSLIPNLILNIKDNLRYFSDLKLFELGRVFLPELGKDPRDAHGREMLNDQPKYLSGCVVNENKKILYYEVKKSVEVLLKGRGIEYEIIPSKELLPWAHPARSADILINNEKAGVITELNPKAGAKFDIKQKVGLFELNFSIIFGNLPAINQYKPLPKFPSVFLDISVVLDNKVLSSEVECLIKKTGGDLVKKVELFDIYQGENIGAGKKSLAYHMEFRSDKKTLDMEEAEKLRDGIGKTLEKELGGQVRK